MCHGINNAPMAKPAGDSDYRCERVERLANGARARYGLKAWVCRDEAGCQCGKEKCAASQACVDARCVKDSDGSMADEQAGGIVAEAKPKVECQNRDAGEDYRCVLTPDPKARAQAWPECQVAQGCPCGKQTCPYRTLCLENGDCVVRSTLEKLPDVEQYVFDSGYPQCRDKGGCKCGVISCLNGQFCLKGQCHEKPWFFEFEGQRVVYDLSRLWEDAERYRRTGDIRTENGTLAYAEEDDSPATPRKHDPKAIDITYEIDPNPVALYNEAYNYIFKWALLTYYKNMPVCPNARLKDSSPWHVNGRENSERVLWDVIPVLSDYSCIYGVDLDMGRNFNALHIDYLGWHCMRPEGCRCGGETCPQYARCDGDVCRYDDAYYAENACHIDDSVLPRYWNLFGYLLPHSVPPTDEKGFCHCGYSVIAGNSVGYVCNPDWGYVCTRKDGCQCGTKTCVINSVCLKAGVCSQAIR